MKKLFFLAMSLLVTMTTFAYNPTGNPTDPTWPADQVKAIYSSTYGADCGVSADNAEYTQDTYGKKFTNIVGPFALTFTGMNCSKMQYLHFDLYADGSAPFTITVVPICGGSEVSLVSNNFNPADNAWISVDMPLSAFTGTSNWSNVTQIKITNATSRTFWLNNVYFYTEESPEEDEYIYAKNNWDGGTDWTWKEMTKSGDVYVLDNVVFGGTGVNINTEADDAGSFWYDLKAIQYASTADSIQALDTVKFEYSQDNGTLTATLLGRPTAPYHYTTNTEWKIKYNDGTPNWGWKDLTQVGTTNEWTTDITWRGSGLNVGSCAECPIKKDWYPANEITGGDIAANTPVMVKLTVVDDETVTLELTQIVITYDTIMCVAGNFTNWAAGMKELPYTVTLPADSTLQFKQVRQIIKKHNDTPVDTTLTWYGQVNAGAYMTRESNAWTLNGENNVLLYTDEAGEYTFSLEGETFTVAFPIATALEETVLTGEVKKFLRNGQLYIRKGNILYNAQGQVVK